MFVLCGRSLFRCFVWCGLVVGLVWLIGLVAVLSFGAGCIVVFGGGRHRCFLGVAPSVAFVGVRLSGDSRGGPQWRFLG